MSTDYPTLSEIGEENVRGYWKRERMSKREEGNDENRLHVPEQ